MKIYVLAFAPVLIAILLLFNKFAPEPYMDEFFHVRQTQTYCKGNWWHWDEKITTLPGVYFVAWAALKAASAITSTPLELICTVDPMRFVSVLFGMINWILICALAEEDLTRARGIGSAESVSLWERALPVFLFPPIFFFYFLFYTDAGGLACVLLCMYCFKRASHLLPAIKTGIMKKSDSTPIAPVDPIAAVNRKWVLAGSVAGAIAILFRQTNIIWVAFSAATLVVEIYETSHPLLYHKSNESHRPLSSELPGLVRFGLSSIPALALLFAPAIILAGLFLAFLWHNGGITVGDRTAHEAVFHWPQLLYFCLFSAVFLSTRLISTLGKTIESFGKLLKSLLTSPARLAVFALVAVLNALAVHKFTYAHLYLISDNRHYTFYIWKRIFARHSAAKFALLPVYAASFWALWTRIISPRQSPLWKLMFFACTAVTIIPAQLIEFRYFIIPFTILAINARPIESRAWRWLEILAYLGINLATIVVFLFYPFTWPDGSIARFMW